MKKIMIALAAVAFAIGAQAATYNWKAATGYIYQNGTTSKLTTGTAYLFNETTISQQALLTALLAGNGLDSLSFVSTGSVNSNGQVAISPDFTYNGVAGGTTWNAYMAVMDGDNVYISNTKAVVAPEDQSAMPIAIGSNTAASKLAAVDSETFNGAGWYNTAAVPEPTSALMLLVGLAGLALKRKVA